MVELKIKYKGPAPDGSRASLVGNPKDLIGMVSMPLCKILNGVVILALLFSHEIKTRSESEG